MSTRSRLYTFSVWIDTWVAISIGMHSCVRSVWDYWKYNLLTGKMSLCLQFSRDWCTSILNIKVYVSDKYNEVQHRLSDSPSVLASIFSLFKLWFLELLSR